MTGHSDTEAEERAELLSLRDRAALRRKELGETVGLVTARVASAPGLQAWARQAAAAAARSATRAVRTTAARTLRTHRLPVAAAAAGGCLLVAAAAWRATGQPPRHQAAARGFRLPLHHQGLARTHQWLLRRQHRLLRAEQRLLRRHEGLLRAQQRLLRRG